MSFSHLFKYALSLPPHIALGKALVMAKKHVTGAWQARQNANKCTYHPPSPVNPKALPSLLKEGLPALSEDQHRPVAAWSAKTLAHEFNLLGSGWVRVERKGSDPELAISNGNLGRSRDITGMLTPGYRAINWHTDFRSGYQWSAAQSSESVLYGHEPGVDIKVPWELARMQHLPQLAFACAGGKPDNQDPLDPQTCCNEFQNQTLDFMATNPPGYGVNWVCTMDVAIRAANLILAFDLFRARPTTIDAAFTDEFVATIRAHGAHIATHLEWHDGYRGNHYLADITGLLFVAAFLPCDPETDGWLCLAVQEFVREVDIQFNRDGTNGEASTSYHRLSAEMVAYGTALILGLSSDKKAALADFDGTNSTLPPHLTPASMHWSDSHGPFSPDHFDRLHRMAQFTRDITKPDRHIVQIGDTDNGRFFKLCPALLPGTLEEDHLDHHHLLAAIGGLLDDPELRQAAGIAYNPEAELIRSLKANNQVPTPTKANPPAALPPLDPPPSDRATSAQRLTIELPFAVNSAELQAIAYPDFGLYIWRSERLFMTVRCGPVGQAGNGGHAHNDQLSFELQIDGEDWVADPGTYTYTADPKRRDQYRSHFAHAGPRLQQAEPSRLNLGLFRLEDNARALCKSFSESEFFGLHRGYGIPTYRQIRITAQSIEITDTEGGWPAAQADMTETTVRTARDLQRHVALTVPFSRGYGLSD